jgi:hypothetical protein
MAGVLQGGPDTGKNEQSLAWRCKIPRKQIMFLALEITRYYSEGNDQRRVTLKSVLQV